MARRALADLERIDAAARLPPARPLPRPREPIPMPLRVRPMLATPSALPAGEGWAYEVKWDGVRAIVASTPERVVVSSRALLDVTAQFPEVPPLGPALDGTRALLDGEIVVLDAHGRPSFQLLQSRIGVSSRRAVAQKRAEVPAVFMAFDVLHLDGISTMALPYYERRRLLEDILPEGDAWRPTPVRVGDGEAMLEGARRAGFEGVVAKRLDARYEPGVRTDHWRKVKLTRRQEVVVGGFTRGRGQLRGRLGSLLVGVHDSEGRLRFAGSVGTGLRDADRVDLLDHLSSLVRPTSPFSGPVDKPGAWFVEPRLVVEVEFTEWTRGGRLRHPSFKGLRHDKDPRAVVREEVADA